MEQFVYKAPVPTLRNRIQYIKIKIAEGSYAKQEAGSCGDSLQGGKVAQMIIRAASLNKHMGYTKSDIEVYFDTGWVFYTGFDIREHSTVYDLLDQIDREAQFYTGTKPAHYSQEQYNEWVPYMNPDKVDGFVKLFSHPEFNH